jgi:hypothetical protein
VESRAGAILELAAALKEEREAIAFLKRDPPQTERARTRMWRAVDRMYGIQEWLSTVPGADAENLAGGAAADDVAAATVVPQQLPDPKGIEKTLFFLERAVVRKQALQPLVRTAKPPVASPQCSDGKDNDGDRLIDAKSEPGCSSARDARERSPFRCAIGSKMSSGRLALSGSCTGAFAEVEVTLLDGVQLNGRFDIQRAPSCRPPEPRGLRCSTKDGAQNPRHLVSMQLTTTSQDPAQRVQLRFFDALKRQLGRFVTARR